MYSWSYPQGASKAQHICTVAVKSRLWSIPITVSKAWSCQQQLVHGLFLLTHDDCLIEYLRLSNILWDFCPLPRSRLWSIAGAAWSYLTMSWPRRRIDVSTFQSTWSNENYQACRTMGFAHNGINLHEVRLSFILSIYLVNSILFAQETQTASYGDFSPYFW